MSANSPPRPKGISLVLHTLAPTGLGIIVSLIAALIITVIHLLLLSVSGTAYPINLNDTLLTGYANFIIQPLSVLANNGLLASGLTLLLWGTLGSVVCAGIGAAANALNDWRNTREDVNMTQYGVYIRHPVQHSLVVRFIWRLAIGVLIALYTAAALIAAQTCLSGDLHILSTSSVADGAWQFLRNIGVWLALFHGYIILLRLYLLRTRLFGEILY